MASIKKLKSGTTPCSESGNSDIPDVQVDLRFGQVDTQNLIQQQANSVMTAQVKSASKGGTVKH